jgi:hypothetical protein
MVICVVITGWIVPGSSSGSGADGKVPDKAPATVDNQLDYKKATDVKVEETGKGKHADDTDPVKKEESEKVPPKSDRGNVKAGDKKESLEAGSGVKRAKGEAKEDRPWIIKMRDRGESQTPKEKAKPLKWNSEEQRVQCDTHLKNLHRSLSKARLFSVRGDTCATAKHAKIFVDLANRCKNECPDGFLESKGYSEKIIKNVSALLELGKKACLDDR